MRVLHVIMSSACSMSANSCRRLKAMVYLCKQSYFLTGKSLILEKVLKEFYEPEDVGILSNNGEELFGLSAIFDKNIFYCSEVNNKFNLEQSKFQQMVQRGERQRADQVQDGRLSAVQAPRVPGRERDLPAQGRLGELDQADRASALLAPGAAQGPRPEQADQEGGAHDPSEGQPGIPLGAWRGDPGGEDRWTSGASRSRTSWRHSRQFANTLDPLSGFLSDPGNGLIMDPGNLNLYMPLDTLLEKVRSAVGTGPSSAELAQNGIWAEMGLLFFIRTGRNAIDPPTRGFTTLG